MELRLQRHYLLGVDRSGVAHRPVGKPRNNRNNYWSGKGAHNGTSTRKYSSSRFRVERSTRCKGRMEQSTASQPRQTSAGKVFRDGTQHRTYRLPPSVLRSGEQCGWRGGRREDELWATYGHLGGEVLRAPKVRTERHPTKASPSKIDRRPGGRRRRGGRFPAVRRA